MMYSHRFVCAIKVGGKILREINNIVTLPFGTEYTILLKNLEARRSQVKVSVDGTDATDGTSLILQPNSSLELERYIRNGNMNRGNKFRFIERTEQIENHRGIGSDDGLVRVEYCFEQQPVVEEIVRKKVIVEKEPYYPWDPYYPKPWYPRREIWLDRKPMDEGEFPLCKSSATADSSCLRSMAGITVPGSESVQKFHRVSGFSVETIKHVMVLQLHGEVAGKPVMAPVTVKHKPSCSTCGKTNKPQANFCSFCGTAMELI